MQDESMNRGTYLLISELRLFFCKMEQNIHQHTLDTFALKVIDFRKSSHDILFDCGSQFIIFEENIPCALDTIRRGGNHFSGRKCNEAEKVSTNHSTHRIIL